MCFSVRAIDLCRYSAGIRPTSAMTPAELFDFSKLLENRYKTAKYDTFAHRAQPHHTLRPCVKNPCGLCAPASLRQNSPQQPDADVHPYVRAYTHPASPVIG